MKTIEQIALEAIDKIRPAYAESLEQYAESSNPEIIAAREVIESRRQNDADIVADAIREWVEIMKGRNS